MMTIICFSSLLLLLSPCPVYARELSLGDATIQLPTPSGCADITSTFPDVVRNIQAQRTDVRILAIFVPEAEVANVAAGKQQDFKVLCIVQIPTSLLSTAITASSFSQLKAQVQKQASEGYNGKEIAERLIHNNGLKGITPEQLEGQMGTLTLLPLGAPIEGGDYIISSSLLRQRISGDSRKETILKIMSAGSVLANGRAIQAIRIQPYKSEKDLDNSKQRTESWVRDIIARNTALGARKGSADTSQVPPSGFEWKVNTAVTSTLYSSKGHPKAGDIDFCLKYPSSWEAKEGDRPHVVQKFIGPASNGYRPMFVIIVTLWPPDVQKEMAQLKKKATPEEMRQTYEEFNAESMAKSDKQIQSGMTRVEGEEVYWSVVSRTTEYARNVFYSQELRYLILLPSGLLMLSGSVVSEPSGRAEDLAAAYAAAEPIFQKFIMSLVINSKWTTQIDTQLDTKDITPRSGSGFFVTTDGWFVTNAHVLRPKAKVTVNMHDSSFPAIVKKIDESNDLALLKIEGRFPAIAIEHGTQVHLGAPVFTVGFPNPELQGVSPKMTKGEISSLAGAKDDLRYFQISVPVQPGNSGGPLANISGNVVGVVTARIADLAAIESSGAIPQNVNYAIQNTCLLSFLESVPELHARLVQPSGPVDFSVAVEAVEKASAMITVSE
jgi:S1-C subfamily serine protease